MVMMLSPGGCCCDPDDCFRRNDAWNDDGNGVPVGWTLDSGSVTFEASGNLTLAAGTRLVRSWDWEIDPVVITQVATSPTAALYIGCDATTAADTDLRRFGQYARATATEIALVHRLADHPSLTSEIVDPADHPTLSYVDSELYVMREKTTSWPGYLLFRPSFVKQTNGVIGTGDHVADLRSRDDSLSVHALTPYGYPIDPYATDLHILNRWIVNPGAGNSPVGGLYGLLFPPYNEFSANNNQGSQLTHSNLVIESESQVTIGPIRVENFCQVAPSWGGGFVEADQTAWSFLADLSFDFQGINLPRSLPEPVKIFDDTSTFNLGGTVPAPPNNSGYHGYVKYTNELYLLSDYDFVNQVFDGWRWRLAVASGPSGWETIVPTTWDQPTDSYVSLARSQTFSAAGHSGPEWLGSHSVLRFPSLVGSQFAGEVVLIWDEASDTTTILVSIGVGTVAPFFVVTGPQYQFTWGKTVAGPLDETTQSHVLPLLYSYGQYGETPESSWAIGDLTISW